MKAGVSTACLYPELLENALSQLAKTGIKNTEIFINTHSELQTEFTDLLKNILNNNNVSCSAVHPFTCPSEPMMFFSSYERRVDDIIDYYKYYFETMNKFGAKILVFHGNKRIHPAPEELYFERFGRLAMTAEEFGVIAAQENVERCQSNSLEFMKNMSLYLGKYANFVLDVKQAVRSHEDPFEIASQLGDKIVHVHMSDHNAERDCMLLSKGNFDIEGFLKILSKKGFDGSVILELYRQNFNDISQLYESYRYLCDIINNIEKEAG
ncbi:MAG: sugar phosphate isomerase/epimerase [Ruminococcus sp.]|nr:sugar phosphate isomerase/epimerase [Ruminococcus sp.]